ncbi:MAG: ferritin-like domain-containing protein [Jatrophihabitantaceae bacterium]
MSPKNSNRAAEEIAITERELNAMTAELDMLHKETFPGVQKTFADFRANLAHLRTSSQSTGRRSFLLGVGGVAVVGGVAACSSSGGTTGTSSGPSTSPTSGPPTSSSTPAGSKYTGDLKVVALAAALENLAVAAYGGAIQMAGQKKLGAVPPAVATFAATAMSQHKDHAAGWNSVLSKNNVPAITNTPLTIAKGEVAKLGQAKNVIDVAKLALSLENAAAATYQFAVMNVTDPGGIVQAATIQPVEAMHAAILNFVLGQYPVPMNDIGITEAVQPSALTV